MEISFIVHSKLEKKKKKRKSSVPVLKISIWHDEIKSDVQNESIKSQNSIISEIQFIFSFPVPSSWLFKTLLVIMRAFCVDYELQSTRPSSWSKHGHVDLGSHTCQLPFLSLLLPLLSLSPSTSSSFSSFSPSFFLVAWIFTIVLFVWNIPDYFM